MISRRALVTGGALGALASSPAHAGTSAPVQDQAEQSSTRTQSQDAALLKSIDARLASLGDNVSGLPAVFRTNSVAFGFIPKLRDAYTLYWKTHGKFPEFVEVGTDVFYDIYDYHVKQQLPIPVNRLSDGRLSITYMYTQLLVRVDQTAGFIGVPFDRQ
jgi:hypothetical protein